MFEDFLNKDYWKMKRKIATIRELINRFMQLSNITDIDSISERVERLDDRVQNLGGWINVERLPPDEPRPPEEGEETVLLPDLIVSEITVEEQTNVMAFTITVKNQGTAVSGACKLDVDIPGQNTETITVFSIPSLSVGQTTTLHHQYSFDASSIESKSTHTIIATVDSTNIITESNEANNTRNMIFVSLPQKLGVIVHIHNPEGFEIGSLVSFSDIPTSSIGGVSHNEATHGIPATPSPGDYTVTVTFNEITLQKNITVVADETQELFFIFERTEHVPNFSEHQDFAWEESRSDPRSSLQPPDWWQPRVQVGEVNPWRAIANVLVDYSPSEPPWPANFSMNGTTIANLTLTNFNWILSYSVNGTPPTAFPPNYPVTTNWSTDAQIDFSVGGFLGNHPLPTITDFKKWYLQQVLTGEMLTVRYDAGKVLVKGNIPGYSTWSFNVDYVINFDLFATGSIASEDYGYPRFVRGSVFGDAFNSSDSKSGGGSLTNYAMSSIPYDMNNVAV